MRAVLICAGGNGGSIGNRGNMTSREGTTGAKQKGAIEQLNKPLDSSGEPMRFTFQFYSVCI